MVITDHGYLLNGHVFHGGWIDEVPKVLALPGPLVIVSLIDPNAPFCDASILHQGPVVATEHYPMGDDPSDAMTDEGLRSLVSKILVHLESSKNIYLHCHAGQSRSGYIHAAMRMTVLHETADEAIAAITAVRPLSLGPLTGIKLNVGFTEHLKRWVA